MTIFQMAFHLIGLMICYCRKLLKQVELAGKSQEEIEKKQQELEKEATYLIKLSHPNVLKGFCSFIFDSVEGGRLFGIVTEFCEVSLGFSA